MDAGTEVRVKEHVETGSGMRGVTTHPIHKVEPGVVVVQLVGMPLGLMEYKEDELEVIR